MKRVNIHDAKAHFSRYLAELPAGTLVVRNRNEPIAEIRSLAKRTSEPRIGVAKDKLTVPDSFFEPLPEAILKSFEGG